jgi:hypothetical protein
MLVGPRAADGHELRDGSRAKTEHPDQASVPDVAHARDNVHGPQAVKDHRNSSDVITGIPQVSV